MRILISVHRFPPFIGGSERVAAQIANALLRAGHEVVVATGRHAGREESKVTVIEFDLSGNLIWPQASDCREALRYREFFESDEWSARLIYAGQTWCLGLVSDLIGRGTARDVFAPCGFSWLGTKKHNDYFDQMAQVLPRFTKVIYHSSQYQDFRFAESRGLLDNAIVIPNGVELGEFDGCVPNGVRLGLLTVGSHVRSKGHRDFIRIARILRSQATIVAPHPKSLREGIRGCFSSCLVRSASNERINLVDGSHREAVLQQYRNHAIFVLPSAIECSPLVLLEAMAAGLPWVSYDVGNVKELLGGTVAMSVEEASTIVQQLLLDRELWARKCAEGRAFAESRSWDVILPRYVATLAGPRWL